MSASTSQLWVIARRPGRILHGPHLLLSPDTPDSAALVRQVDQQTEEFPGCRALFCDYRFIIRFVVTIGVIVDRHTLCGPLRRADVAAGRSDTAVIMRSALMLGYQRLPQRQIAQGQGDCERRYLISSSRSPIVLMPSTLSLAFSTSCS
jgi:hypothetical protein